MTIERLILCFIAPPLSVIDRDLSTIVLVLFFTVLGWVPGVLVALGILVSEWYYAREHAKQAATTEAMQSSIQQREQLVNLPETYRSGEERLDKAVRGQAWVEAQNEKQVRNKRRH